MARPDAVKDVNSIYLNDTDGKVSGNILANDTPGTPGETIFLYFLNSERVADNGKGGDNFVQAKYGSFVVFNNGDYTYTLDKTNPDVIAALANGTGLTEKVPVKIGNKGGETDFDYLTIDIMPANNKPVAVKDFFTESNGEAAGNVLLNDIDADGDTLFVARIGQPFTYVETDGSVATTIEGKYGSISMFSTGEFTYTVDATDADYLALAPGETGVESFNYRIADEAFGSVPNANSTAVGYINIDVTNDGIVLV